MVIHDVLAATLIPLLKERFSDRPLVLRTDSPAVATFPAAHPDVGDLVIQDDGDELTLYVGKFTHVHFDDVDETVAFLEDLFHDRIEIFGDYRGGGYRKRDGTPRGYLSKLFFGHRSYVWSGPLDG